MLNNIKSLSLTKKLVYKIVFFIFCLIPFFSGLDTVPPLDRDESRFVQSTYQMIETNDYINIKFLDEIRAKKPIGIYWAQSLFANIFGEDKISSYRYVSTFGALITILILWKFSQILFGQKASLFVVSASMISLLFIFESHVAKTDTLLLSFITLQQFLLLKIILNKKKSILFDLIIPISMWLVLGIGFLIKGPIALVVFIFTLSSYVLWNKDIYLLKNIRPFWGIICFMIIVLPWVYIIQKTTDGLFFEKAVNEDFLPKLFSEQESHGGYPGYYFLISSLIFWPLASFFPLAFFFVKNNLSNLGIRFLICWLVPFWIIIEFIPTKLFHYPLPIFSPIILIVAGTMIYFENNKLNLKSFISKNSVFLFSLLFSLGGIVLSLFLCYLLINFNENKTDQYLYIAILFLISFLILILSILVNVKVIYGKKIHFFNFKKEIKFQNYIIFFSVIFYITIFTFVLPSLKYLFPSKIISDELKKLNYEELSVTGYHEPSLVFLAKGKIILSDPNEAAIFLAEGNNNLVLVEGRELDEFINSSSNLNIKLKKIREIKGFNYSKGQNIKILFFKVAK